MFPFLPNQNRLDEKHMEENFSERYSRPLCRKLQNIGERPESRKKWKCKSYSCFVRWQSALFRDNEPAAERQTDTHTHKLSYNPSMMPLFGKKYNHARNCPWIYGLERYISTLRQRLSTGKKKGNEIWRYTQVFCCTYSLSFL